MPLTFDILGDPGRDNGVLTTVDTGQAVYRLLFDCGADVLKDVSAAHVQTIDGLFFSHFHIDHVAGFDAFLRQNFYRDPPPVRVFGPEGTREILHHRLQGVTWNLVGESSGVFEVTELSEGKLRTTQFKTVEGFRNAHDVSETEFSGVMFENDDMIVHACQMNHGVLTLAYRVTEKPRRNIDMGAVAKLGLSPGPWLQQLKKESVSDDEKATVAGQTIRIGDLRRDVMSVRLGASMAYLTDFMLDPTTEPQLTSMLDGVQFIVCENNYRNADKELANKNFHMTSSEVARLAAVVNPQRLVLFHLSDRYNPSEWREQLQEVASVFPRVEFPETWRL